jgi:eukaryotic translation initiation factor 2C
MQPYRVVYRAEDEDQTARNATTYQLRLENAGSLRISGLMDNLTSVRVGAMFASKNEILQILNIVLGHHPKSNPGVFSMGANKHFDLVPANSETISIGTGLKVIIGFFVSVWAAASRILVSVQVKHAAYYEIGPPGGSISAYLAQNDGAMFKLETFLEKVRVEVAHICATNRRIKNIASLARPGDGQGLQHPLRVAKFAAGPRDVIFFVDRPGGQSGYTSVFDHFRRSKYLRASITFQCLLLKLALAYNIPAMDPNLPVVNVGTQQNPSYLIVDVCIILPGSPAAPN